MTVARIYAGPWRVDLEREAGPRLLSGAALARLAGRALDAAGASAPASIGITLADDARLAELNREHMGIDGPTDVLSFPLLPPEAYPAHTGRMHPGFGAGAAGPSGRPGFVLPPGRRPHLGDIVVSVERAIAQAEEGRGGQTGDVRWSPADELRLLVVHGVLHVCGWDHAEPDERAAMRELELEVLGQ